MIRDEFMKTAKIKYQTVRRSLVGGSADTGGDLFDKAFSKPKQGFFSKIKNNFSNKDAKIKKDLIETQKAQGMNPDISPTSKQTKTKGMENPVSNNFDPENSRVIKGLKGVGNTAAGIGAAGLFGVTAMTNNLADATSNAFNPNR